MGATDCLGNNVFRPDLTRTLSNNGISYTVHNIRNNKEEIILWIETDLN